MGFTTVTVVGQYLKADGETPAKGRLTFQLSARLQDSSSDEIVAATSQRVKLDDEGRFSVELVATDDSTTAPVGATYLVTENIRGSLPRSFVIELSHLLDTVDLADISPVIYQPSIYDYVLQTAFNAHLSDSPAHAADHVGFTPAAGVAATNVQAAVEELAADATGIAGRVGTLETGLAAEMGRAETAEGLLATDTLVVHRAGTETVTGAKDFTGGLTKSGVTVETTVGAQAKADAARDTAEGVAATGLAGHVTNGVHPAAHVTVAGVTGLVATDVQAALTELVADILNQEAGDSAAVAAEINARRAGDTAALADAEAYTDLTHVAYGVELVDGQPTFLGARARDLEEFDDVSGLFDPTVPVQVTADGEVVLVEQVQMPLATSADLAAEALSRAAADTAESAARAVNAAEIAAHEASTTAHTASHVTVATGAGVAATDVQGAIAELVTDILNQEAGDSAAVAAEINARSAGDTATLAAAEAYTDVVHDIHGVELVAGRPTFIGTYGWDLDTFVQVDGEFDPALGIQVGSDGTVVLVATETDPLALLSELADEIARATLAETVNAAAIASEAARATAAEAANGVSIAALPTFNDVLVYALVYGE